MKINLEQDFFDYIKEWEDDEFIAMIPVRFITRGISGGNYYIFTYINFILNKIEMTPVVDEGFGIESSGFDLHIHEERILKSFISEFLGIKTIDTMNALNTSYPYEASS
ncbi:hypothetical protein [Siminovitchia fordii]|uniref:Uncharacterized protein n=1 Tax=Siminovitchia fordii TaxID=254759 RepID=A0ABQ4KBM9_9BACI|nr:hypothetical protein [Siminovitchia fordii]GIN22575.1 hypothetical protein J1TS3_37090 [Siminovitchia fordii]